MKKFYKSSLIEKTFKVIFYKNNIYYIGNLGCLRYNYNFKKLLYFKIIKNNNFFFRLSVNKKFLRTFFKLFLKNIHGISFGWFMNIKFKGRGFHIFLVKNIIRFNIGLSHIIIFKVPKNIKIKCIKENIYLYSINMNKIFNLAKKIKNLRKVDSYKGKGIYFLNDKILLKVGKKI